MTYHDDSLSSFGLSVNVSETATVSVNAPAAAGGVVERLDKRFAQNSSHARETPETLINRAAAAVDLSVKGSTLKLLYKMLNVGRELLPNEKIIGCQRHVIAYADVVSVKYSRERAAARYQNLETCDSDGCPYCARRRAADHRLDLTAALANADRMGKHVSMFTFTLSHAPTSRLKDLMGALNDAYNRVFSGRWFTEFKRLVVLAGRVVHLETTMGANGWHPHFHVLMFTDHPLTADMIAKLKPVVFKRWYAAVRKSGFNAVVDAFDIRAADSDVAEYVSKYGKLPENPTWGAESEMTMSNVKRATRGGVTVFEVIAAAAGEVGERFAHIAKQHGEEDAVTYAKGLYQEFFYAQKGRQLVRWSTGLKALLMVDDTAAELLEQLAAAERPLWQNAASIQRGRDGWSKVLARELRAELLLLVATGDAAAVDQWLALHGIDSTVFLAFYQQWAAGIDF